MVVDVAVVGDMITAAGVAAVATGVADRPRGVRAGAVPDAGVLVVIVVEKVGGSDVVTEEQEGEVELVLVVTGVFVAEADDNDNDKDEDEDATGVLTTLTGTVTTCVEAEGGSESRDDEDVEDDVVDGA